MPLDAFEGIAKRAGGAGGGPLGAATDGAGPAIQADAAAEFVDEKLAIGAREFRAVKIIVGLGRGDILFRLGEALPVGLAGLRVEHHQSPLRIDRGRIG